MSLINEALKKAQRERGGSAPSTSVPTPGGGLSHVTPAGPRAPMRAGSPFVALAWGATAAIFTIAVGVGYFLLRDSHDTPTAQAKPVGSSPVAVVNTAPAPSVTVTTSTPALNAENGAMFSLNLAPTSPAPPASEVPTIEPGPRPQPASPAPSYADVMATVDAFRITGVRTPTNDAPGKVLMNERVYRVGDIVDYRLGLRLSDISPSRLVFIDADGVTYPRNY